MTVLSTVLTIVTAAVLPLGPLRQADLLTYNADGVYLIDVGRRQHVRIAPAIQASWSPSGEHALVFSSADASYALADETLRILQVLDGVIGWEWAPDGRTLAFLRQVHTVEQLGPVEVYTVSVEAPAPALRLTLGYDLRPAILWSSGSELLVPHRAPSGGFQVQPIPADSTAALPDIIGSWPTIRQRFLPAPDGNHLVFSTNADDGGIQLFTVDLTAGPPYEPHLLVEHDADRSTTPLSWSPDGTRLIYRVEAQYSDRQECSLVVHDLGSDEQRQLIDIPFRRCIQGGLFSPSGRYVYYVETGTSPPRHVVIDGDNGDLIYAFESHVDVVDWKP